VQGELELLLELSAADKLESCYEKEYSEAYRIAEKLGVKLDNYPAKLAATAEELAQEKEKQDRIAKIPRDQRQERAAQKLAAAKVLFQ